MKKTLWITFSIAAVVAIVLVALPIGIERYAERWMSDQGIPEPAIEDVDLNPFTGVLRIESLSFSGPERQRGEIGFMEVNFEWMKVLARRVALSNVAITDGQIDIHMLPDGRIAIGGLLLPLTAAQEPDLAEEPEAEGTVWGLGVSDVTVEEVQITYRDELLDSQLDVRRIALDSLATWEPENVTEVSADLLFDGAKIRLRAEAVPFASELRITSTVKVDTFRFDAYSAIFNSVGIQDPQGSLSLDLSTTFRIPQGGAFYIETAGAVEVNDAVITLPMAKIRNKRMAWTGNVSATVSGDAESAPVVSGTHNLNVLGLMIHHPDKPIRLVSLEELAVKDATISSPDQIGILNVTMNSFELLRSDDADDATLTIAQTTLDNIEIATPSVVTIERVNLDTAVVQITREQDGQIRLVSETTNDFTQVAAESQIEAEMLPTDVEAPEENPFRFLIGQIDIGGASRIDFVDSAVTPPVSSAFTLNAVRLTAFGNIDPEQSAHIVFDLQQNDSASFVGEGDLVLFGEQPKGDITISLKRFDLTQLSPYVPGYHIQRGRLSLESRASLAGDAIDVKNSVLVERLDLSGKSVGDQELLGKGMAMPLDVALDLMRDGDDRIKLEIPISGSLKDPEFGTADIIRVATQNALQQAAVSYVKNALQPLGSILLLAKIAGQVSRPRFEPVSFEPGAIVLSTEGRAYLDKIQKLLADRPGLSITFCGVATVSDRDFLIAQMVPAAEVESEEIADPPTMVPPAEVESKELVKPPTFETERLELAQARGTAVQDYLTDERGIDVARLFRCRPRIEVEGDQGPRVEITL